MLFVGLWLIFKLLPTTVQWIILTLV